MNLNLSKFHKIECDDNCTTLEHPSGHQIKIAHKHLSDHAKKELENIPVKMAKGGSVYDPSKGSKASKSSAKSKPQGETLYTEPQDIGTPKPPMQQSLQGQKYPPCINPSCKSYGMPHPNCKCYIGHFAEGGSAESFCSKDQPHQKGCQYFAEGTPNAPVEQPSQDQVQQVSQQAPTSVTLGPQDMPEQPEINPNPERAPSDVADQQAPKSAMEAADSDPAYHATAVHGHLIDQDAQVQSAIDSGQIHPKTYRDLFNNKTTLGKISTLFGLMIGGAGSGLAGQENSLLHMMDNEIKNDMSSQTYNQANRNHLLKLNQEALANAAGVHLSEAQANNMAQANEYMAKNRVALDGLSKYVMNLPAGSPDRVKGEKMLLTLRPMVDAKNSTIATQAAIASAMSNQVNGTPGQGTFLMKSGIMGPEMKEMGEDIEQKTIPGHGRATIPVPQHDRDQISAMDVLSDKAADVMKYADKNFATIDPKKRTVAEQKANELVNFYNSSLGGALTGYKIDWLDKQIKANPTGVISQLLGNQQRLQEIKSSNDHRRDILLQKYGVPVKKQSQGDQSGEAKAAPLERYDPKTKRTILYDPESKQPIGTK